MVKDYRPLIIITIFLAFLPFEHQVKFPYYVNLTPSEPVGLYRLIPLRGQAQIGDKVFIIVPDQARPYVYGRGWLPRDWPLLKTVRAVPGDRYGITKRAITINSRYIGPVFNHDSQGKPLPRLRGNFVVKEGHFLPIATRIKNSFDGRYFGQIPTHFILGKAVPIITFRAWKEADHAEIDHLLFVNDTDT